MYSPIYIYILIFFQRVVTVENPVSKSLCPPVKYGWNNLRLFVNPVRLRLRNLTLHKHELGP